MAQYLGLNGGILRQLLLGRLLELVVQRSEQIRGDRGGRENHSLRRGRRARHGDGMDCVLLHGGRRHEEAGGGQAKATNHWY